ncbi:hypothetical protein SAMN06269117_11347 [Balnearium lithotrophicum]|uniref:Uncharacterized protein n=1 Tax=Balnearium lithotrophicum TaxID=223788 RepID=A0A521CJR0_9BACT|nr:hypothetical protein [Balnearium lithotrophicum]SMO59687.1 hypothetical protein SAMN06269117_11347 [Balnearium lithotrophicum]
MIEIFIRGDGMGEMTGGCLGNKVITFYPRPFFQKKDDIYRYQTLQDVFDYLENCGCNPRIEEERKNIPKVNPDSAHWTIYQIVSSYLCVQRIEDFLICLNLHFDKVHTLFYYYSDDWAVKLFSTFEIYQIINFIAPSVRSRWDCEKIEFLKDVRDFRFDFDGVLT